MKMISVHTEQNELLVFPEFFSHYQYMRTIGCGSSSVVALVREVDTSLRFAAKVISRDMISKGIEREMRLLETVRHQYIMRAEEVVYLDNVIIIVMEYCSRGDLISSISFGNSLSLEVTCKLFAQVLQAVDYLHSHNWAHRDLKPDNILLDNRGDIKLADFGYCEEGSKTLSSTLCGTLFYISPEALRGERYDAKKSDMWSLGMILFCISTGKLPWESGLSEKHIQEIIMSGDLKYTLEMNPDIEKVCRRCLVLDPDLRPTAAALLADPLFAPYAKEKPKEVPRNPLLLPMGRYKSAHVQQMRKPVQQDLVAMRTKMPLPARACRKYLSTGTFALLR